MAKTKQDMAQEQDPSHLSPESRGVGLDAANPIGIGGVYAAEDLEDSGFQDMGTEDMQIPFLSILQKGSPQVEEDNAKYVPGAKPGNLINTVTLDLFDGVGTGVRFIPVHREHKYLEWIPRDSGGGLAGTYDPESEFVRKAKGDAPRFGKIELDNGNDLVETFNLYGLVVSEDGQEHTPVLLTFASTQIKHYKRWMTQARSITTRDAQGRRITPPLYAHVYRLKTIKEQNTKGTWFGWSVRLDGKDATVARLPQDSELYNAAKDFRALVTSGAVKAATDSLAASEPQQDGPDTDKEF